MNIFFVVERALELGVLLATATINLCGDRVNHRKLVRAYISSTKCSKKRDHAICGYVLIKQIFCCCVLSSKYPLIDGFLVGETMSRPDSEQQIIAQYKWQPVITMRLFLTHIPHFY